MNLENIKVDTLWIAKNCHRLSNELSAEEKETALKNVILCQEQYSLLVEHDSKIYLVPDIKSLEIANQAKDTIFYIVLKTHIPNKG